ncbi:hypothetical protein N9263_00790 [Candidatus Marinimicrobia bacterium]|nr:hypothetical protein [Candidatus Neomarinimicrobiota bacterium]
MKLLYPLIILFAFSFADVVTFKHQVFFIPYETTKEDVIFMGISDDINNPKGAFNYTVGTNFIGESNQRTLFIDCDKILFIKDDFMNDISFDCDSPSVLKEDGNIKEAKKGYMGGLFITAGAAILLVQSNKFYRYNSTNIAQSLQYAQEDMKLMNNIAYSLIAIGGVLVFVGI